MKRLCIGEQIAAVSAVALFVLMFFDWFGVNAVNTSNLLGLLESVLAGKNAWEALYYISMVLLVTSFATIVAVALSLAGALRRPAVAVHTAVVVLGLASTLLILYRIVDPPVFYVGATVTYEGAIQSPMWLALFAAAGIALGGCLTLREEGGVLFGRRRHRHPAKP